MITIKSKQEISTMKKAGEIVALTHERLKEIISPGITTIELDRIAEECIRKNFATPSFKGYKGVRGSIDFPACICASINNEVIHGIPGKRVLKEGDIISIDIGACFNGYHGDAARTLPVGKISEDAENLIKVTKQSFFEGMKNAVKGNRIINISSAIEDYIKENGYSVIREYVGHGIGKDMHELPQIPNYSVKEKGPRLEEGMTLAIEPMVNQGRRFVKVLNNKWTVVTADGTLSAHYENTIVITDGEPEILTIFN